GGRQRPLTPAPYVPHGSVHKRGRRVCDHLLAAPLHRSLAFAEIDKVAVLVAKHLDLDVSRLLNQLLDIDFMISESAQRLTLRCGERRGQFIAAIDAPHPFTATARDSLQHHGTANTLCELLGLGDGRDVAYRTGNE